MKERRNPCARVELLVYVTVGVAMCGAALRSTGIRMVADVTSAPLDGIDKAIEAVRFGHALTGCTGLLVREIAAVWWCALPCAGLMGELGIDVADGG